MTVEVEPDRVPVPSDAAIGGGAGALGDAGRVATDDLGPHWQLG